MLRSAFLLFVVLPLLLGCFLGFLYLVGIASRSEYWWVLGTGILGFLVWDYFDRRKRGPQDTAQAHQPGQRPPSLN